MKNSIEKSESIGETIYVYFCWTIFATVIALIWVCTLGQSWMIVPNPSWATKIGRVIFTIGMMYLQVVNAYYWLLGINLFDFKKLFKKQL